MDSPLVVEGPEWQVPEESQEEQGELEEWGQWVGEDILVSQESPLGQSTACCNPLEKHNRTQQLASVIGPWKSSLLFKEIFE